MKSFEEMKAERAAKKAEKKYEKLARELDAREKAVNAMEKLVKREKELDKRESDIEWTRKHLDEEQLKQQVSKMRKTLVVKRDKLVNNIMQYQREMEYSTNSLGLGRTSSDYKKLATKTKNSYYALALIEQTLDRLGEVMPEHEWHELIRDLTNGYKTVNAMSHGHDLLNRFSYWFQKARLEMKGDVTLPEMEKYFGKSIDKLLSEDGITETSSDTLVTDDILLPKSALDIRNAARDVRKRAADRVLKRGGSAKRKRTKLRLSTNFGGYD